MKTLLPVLSAFLVLAGPGLAGSRPHEDYRRILAGGCILKKGNIADQFFETGIRLKPDRIIVRHVQKGWKGWIRIHAVARLASGAAWGYADYHPRTGKFVCHASNWEIQYRHASR